MTELRLRHRPNDAPSRATPPRAASGLQRRYLVTLGMVALCTIVSVVGARFLQTTAFVLVFPVGVLAAARFGVGPAAVAASAGVLLFDYMFVPPALAFAVPGPKDGLTLVVMVAVATLVCLLAEQLRRQAQSARRQTEIERARNALLSALSHDLRTPLTVLVGASSALCEEQLDSLQRREFSRMVAVESNRLNRLVGNLLDLTRLESGRAHKNQNGASHRRGHRLRALPSRTAARWAPGTHPPRPRRSTRPLGSGARRAGRHQSHRKRNPTRGPCVTHRDLRAP